MGKGTGQHYVSKYQSRDSREFRCDCGNPFFVRVFQFDRDGIRIKQSDEIFACINETDGIPCGKVYKVNIDPELSPIVKIYDPRA
jgi:hypothetical protein